MYIDVYFLINLIIDRCSLECALHGYRLSKWRLWAGAVTGAMGACLWEIAAGPELIRPFWAMGLSMSMLLVCIGLRPKRQWFLSLTKLYGFSFLFAGIVPYVSQYIPLWIGSVLLSYGMIRLWVVYQEKRKIANISLRIETKQGIWQLRAMMDTGHTLRETITGSPVIIVKGTRLPEEIQRTWPVGYNTVQGKGLMFGFWPRNVWIGSHLFKEREILVAVAEDWKEKDCDALVPGYLADLIGK